MRRILISLILLLLFLPAGGQALEMLSGDQVTIDTPIDDDVLVSGGTVTVNAPVSSLTVAGGTVTVNAPVEGDIVAAGGTIDVNEAAGGKLMAAGGEITLAGNVTNMLATGGTITITRTAVVERDAVLSGGAVSHSGAVGGNLTVLAGSFENVGTAGRIDFDPSRDTGWGLAPLLGLIALVFALGFLILGIIAILLFPGLFAAVAAEIRSRPVVKTVVGFFAIIVTAILILIAAVTIIALPLAAVLLLLFILALWFANLFVAFALGSIVVSWFRRDTHRVIAFVLGFIVLYLLFAIPIVGWLIQLIAVSLGYGAILYAARAYRGGTAGAAPA
ncbi:MAG: hypothetical protein PHV57_03875 [Methanomicrobiaceae archaeon]|nr:hypothetical protein [Methanomicrobiaceae archaeon]